MALYFWKNLMYDIMTIGKVQYVPLFWQTNWILMDLHASYGFTQIFVHNLKRLIIFINFFAVGFIMAMITAAAAFNEYYMVKGNNTLWWVKVYKI